VTETPARLRRTGRIIVSCGLVAAAFVYWLYAWGPKAKDIPPAFQHTRSSDNQIKRSMGQFGLVLTDWESALSSPGGYALGVLVLTGLSAGYFYRVASVTEEEARERGGNGGLRS
jgi:hypothetical protein